MTTSIAAVLVGVALAACSGGSGVGETEQGSPPSTSPSESGTGVGSAANAAGTDEFCARIADSLDQSFGLGAVNATSPDAMRQAFERSAAQSESTVSVAPAEIRPDLVVLGAAVAKLRDALAAVNYDTSAVGPEAGIVSTFSSPEVQQAATRTLAYVKAHCGIDRGTLPGGAIPDQEES